MSKEDKFISNYKNLWPDLNFEKKEKPYLEVNGVDLSKNSFAITSDDWKDLDGRILDVARIYADGLDAGTVTLNLDFSTDFDSAMSITEEKLRKEIDYEN